MKNIRKGCYCKKDLLARGWTRALISRFLGKPDFVEHFGWKRQVAHLYIPLRVAHHEASTEWQQAKEEKTK